MAEKAGVDEAREEEMGETTGVAEEEERACCAGVDDASSVTSTGSSHGAPTDDEAEASHKHVEETERPADENDATLPPLELVSESDDDVKLPSSEAHVSGAMTGAQEDGRRILLKYSSQVCDALASWLSMLRRHTGELLRSAEKASNPASLHQSEDEDTSLKKLTHPGSRRQRRRIERYKRHGPSGAQHLTREASCNTSHAPEAPTRSSETLSAISANSDVVFVAFVLATLVGYCAAITYSYFHPIALPLPDVGESFQPWDVSNVSVQFTAPADQAEVFDPFVVEWDLTHFPSQAIRVHGIELFEYRLFLDDRQIVFELDQWEVESDGQSHSINKTMQHRLRPQDISPLPSGSHEHWLRVEVVFAIPGSDGELHTLSDTTSFTIVAPPTSDPHVKITSPTDGSIVAVSSPAIKSSFLLQFEAYNIESLDLILDDEWRVATSLVRTDSFLLRGLALGNHRIALQAKNERGAVIATHTISVELRADDDVSSLGEGPRDPRG